MLRQFCAQVLLEAGPVRFRVQQPRVKQLIEQDGVAREIVGGPARGREHGGDALQGVRMLVEHGEVGGAAAYGFDQREAALEGEVRLHSLGRLLDQARHQRIKAPAAARRQVAVAAAGAHRSEIIEGGRSLGVAEAGELCGRLGGLQRALPQGRHGVAAARGVVGEHRLEMARDRGALARKSGRKRGPIGVTHRACDKGAVLVSRGQFVRLRVLQVLQPVLELAQV